jgi:YggT family protein
MTEALAFLLNVAFGLVTYALLLRFVMQWQRAPFRNPLGQAVTALTDWAVKPVRRVMPGFRGVDWSTLGLAWIAQFGWLLALTALTSLRGLSGSVVPTLALLAAVELIKGVIWILVIAVFVQAILSWVAPFGPLMGLLNALTFRFLAPIRRVVPPLGGTLDLSPLILIVVLQLVLMLPVRWLEGFVLVLFR